MNKRRRNRANRRYQDSKLRVAPKQLDVDEADQVESSIWHDAPKQWKKSPDAPLGEVIAEQRLRRVLSHGRKARAKTRPAVG